jgi:Tfp pilus assembly protein PilF
MKLLRLIPLLILVAILSVCVIYNRQISDYSNKIVMENEAQQALRQKNTAKAAQLYSTLLKKYPAHADYAYQLARLFSEKGKFKLAKMLYETCLKADPKRNDARLALATILGFYPVYRKEARQLLQDGLKQEPGHPLFLMTLGNLYKNQGDNPDEDRENIKRFCWNWASYYYKQALASLDRTGQSWSTMPKETKTLKYGIYFNLALCAQQNNQPDEAAVYFCKASLENPTQYEPQFNLGASLIALNAPKEANEHFRKALEMLRQSGQDALSETLALQAQQLRRTMGHPAKHKDAEDALPENFPAACQLNRQEGKGI